MTPVFIRHTATALMTAGLLAAGGAQGVFASDTHNHDHGHEHGHQHDKDIHSGYFNDDQVKARQLSDWEGDWRSVYPLLQNGTLDSVLAHKAQEGDKSAEEYKNTTARAIAPTSSASTFMART